MNEWEIDIDVWPYSTNESVKDMEIKCGGRLRKFCVSANDVDSALRLAHMIVIGIKTNPAVWHTRITRIEKNK